MANTPTVVNKSLQSLMTYLQSDKTGYRFEIQAVPVLAVLERFDEFTINAFPLNPARPHLPLDDAERAVLSEEVERITTGLVAIVTSVYDLGNKGLQTPLPSYEQRGGILSAVFAAHFATTPVADLEEAEITSGSLRREVLSRLVEIPGFRVVKTNPRSPFVYAAKPV